MVAFGARRGWLPGACPGWADGGVGLGTRSLSLDACVLSLSLLLAFNASVISGLDASFLSCEGNCDMIDDVESDWKG